MFFRVALDQLRINVRADQGDGLLFQVLRLRDTRFFPLLCNLGGCILRRHDPPHLREGIHVEGQVVQLAFVVRHRRIDVVVELHEPIHVVPDFFVGSMEDMGAVLVNPDAVPFLAIDVAAPVRTALQHHENGLACFFHLMGHDSAEQAATDNQVIKHN